MNCAVIFEENKCSHFIRWCLYYCIARKTEHMCLYLQHLQLESLRQVPQLQHLSEEPEEPLDPPTSANSTHLGQTPTPTPKPRTGLSRPPAPVTAQEKLSEFIASKETPKTRRRELAEGIHYTRSTAQKLRRIIPSDTSTDNGGTTGSTSGDNGCHE